MLYHRFLNLGKKYFVMKIFIFKGAHKRNNFNSMRILKSREFRDNINENYSGKRTQSKIV